MRNELKELLDLSHNQDDYDLHHTLWISKNLHASRFELALKYQKEAAKEAKSDEELWAHCDDINYYAFQESHFIWHFCLWRMQAVLEGIIVSKYIQSKDVRCGLKSKLDAMLKKGFSIPATDYNQLLEWAKLRNLLSHSPPSSHNPGPLEESDLNEYYNLCKKLCGSWDIQLAEYKNT